MTAVAAVLLSLGRGLEATQTADAPLAIPYVMTYGIGGYQSSGASTRVLHVQPTITLVPYARGRVGVGLRLAGTLGGIDLENLDDLDLEKVTLVGLTPGVELRVLVGQNALLRPYVDVGAAVGRRDRSATALFVSGGVQGEFVRWWRDLEVGLESRLEYSGSRSAAAGFQEQFAAIGLKVDVRHPLGFEGGSHLPSFGAYVQGRYYLDAVDVGAGDRVTAEGEAGVSFGMCPRPRIAFIPLPRVSVGYRVSAPLRGWRISLSDRLLRCPEGRRSAAASSSR